MISSEHTGLTHRAGPVYQNATGVSNGTRPIFVVGVHRSGTTLLRYMLNSSPRIYIPPESDFIPRFFGRRPDADLNHGECQRLLNIIFGKYRFVKEWQGAPPPAVELIPDLAAGSDQKTTPGAFLRALYSAYARQVGAIRWGDKTPIYTSYVALVRRILPDAQFVHIIRDGRDVALSMLDKWGEREFHVDIYYAARTWKRRIRQAQAAGRQIGSAAYYELRYEALVAEPEAELRKICSFLDEPYVPEMARPQRLARTRIREGDFHAAVRQPPSTLRTERWKDEMAATDQQLFERVAGDQLAELGYARVAARRLLASERLRLARLAAKYTILQAGRSALQATGLVPPI